MSDENDHAPKGDAATELPSSLIGADWLAAQSCQAVFAALEAGGFEGRAVGGSVRNALLGIPVADVDIATPARPEVVAQLAKAAGLGVHETGIEHGTLTIVSSHVPYEVTTLRRDVSTDGRRATVAFTEDWAEDAARRDFTINALYCGRDGKLYDPLGGLPDIPHRNVRFIGSAEERIREDYLRILRFFRFFAVFAEGEIDSVGLKACEQEKDGIARLSGERIHAELLKLLVARRAGEALSVMDRAGILKISLGQDVDLPVFDRMVELESSIGFAPDPIRRLAALIGPDRANVENTVQKLRLSNAESRRLRNAALEKAKPLHAKLLGAKEAIFRHGVAAYRDAILIAWARSNDAVDHADWIASVRLADEWPAPEMPVNGEDVMNLGVPSGPIIGQVLGEFTAWWIENDFVANDEIVRDKLRSLVAQALDEGK
jgi:poly(A) polymerase